MILYRKWEWKNFNDCVAHCFVSWLAVCNDVKERRQRHKVYHIVLDTYENTRIALGPPKMTWSDIPPQPTLHQALVTTTLESDWSGCWEFVLLESGEKVQNLFFFVLKYYQWVEKYALTQACSHLTSVNKHWSFHKPSKIFFNNTEGKYNILKEILADGQTAKS
jgi:hypothetical protein